MCREKIIRKVYIRRSPSTACTVVIHRVAGIVPSIICANITAIKVSSDFGAPTKIRKERPSQPHREPFIFAIACELMQRFDLLVSLPSRLSCIIMQEWITLKSVILLDSAFCFHSHRSVFTDLVQSEEYFICEQVTITSESKIWEAMPRLGEKLRSVMIASRLSSEQETLMVAHCQNLTHVRLSRREAYNGTLLQNILSNKVVSLDLSDQILGHNTWVSILSLCPRVSTLGLARALVRDDTLGELTNMCSHIVHLNIANIHELTDMGILNTVVNLKALRSLNIEGNDKLTDASLVHISTHCANSLNTLHLDCRDSESRCSISAPAFSVSAISDTLRRCTQLHTLSLKGRVSTEDVLITFPLSAFKNLTTLTLNEHIYVENTSATDQLNARVRTLKVDILHSVDSLICFVRIFSHLKEVHLIGNKVEINDQLGKYGKYVRKLAVFIEKLRPESAEDYTENERVKLVLCAA